MACDCVPEWDDGEVMEFYWANQPKALVLINACGVKSPDTYYATYTFDPASGALHFTTPTKTVPPAPGQPPRAFMKRIAAKLDDNVTVKTLDIECWGKSFVAPPTPWSGELTGTVAITFQPNGSISGPVGGVTGP